jgi:uncharacterized membrane protein YfcA
MPAHTLFILLIVLLATGVRSTFGFGESLLAVPLLAFFMPVREAAPLAVLLSITVATVILVQDWKKTHFHSAISLLLATCLGIPFGLLLLAAGDQTIVKVILALLLMAFAAVSLAGLNRWQLHSDHNGWLLGCGFCAGVLGGAFGMNGPPLVIYGALRRWPAPQFRATLQGYFLPASALCMIGYWRAGLWTRPVTHNYLISLPVLLPVIFLGRWIHHRIHPDRFLKFVYVGLMLIGLILLLQTFGTTTALHT